MRPGDVLGLGVAGRMAGILGIDSNAEAVTPYDSWLDSRCFREVEEVTHTLGPHLTAMTGSPPMVANAPKMLWWARAHPNIYRTVSKFAVASTRVGMRLCGLAAGDAYIDQSHLHFTGLVDAGRGEWSNELALAIGLDIERLPRVVTPIEKIGALSSKGANDCGLLPGTVVSAGLGDTAAGALGAGVVRPGQLLDTSGTAAVYAFLGRSSALDSTGTLLSMRRRAGPSLGGRAFPPHFSSLT